LNRQIGRLLVAAVPWEELITVFIANRRQTTAQEVLVECLGVTKSDLKTSEVMRVTGILKPAGWTKRKAKTAAGRCWIWLAPTTTPSCDGRNSVQPRLFRLDRKSSATSMLCPTCPT